MKILPSWLMKLDFRRAHLEGSNSSGADEVAQTSIVHPFDANLITSQVEDEHIVQLDLDVEHFYVESSTSGHGHLYINKPMTFDNYMRLLTLLSELGIIEQGYMESTKKRGYSALRMPGLSKADKQGNVGLLKDSPEPLPSKSFNFGPYANGASPPLISKTPYIIPLPLDLTVNLKKNSELEYKTLSIKYECGYDEYLLKVVEGEKIVKKMRLSDEFVSAYKGTKFIAESISTMLGIEQEYAEKAAAIILGANK